MYRLDKGSKHLSKLTNTSLTEEGMLERQDLEEWLASTPEALHEDLLVLATEYVLPTNLRIDILALDKQANLVVVELKRDKSGSDIEWQSIKYASYCSSLRPDEIYQILADRKKTDADKARQEIEEFIDEELEELNKNQRIILVAGEFHSDVASAVLWLREYEIDVRCVRLRSFRDTDGSFFLSPELIIPLPEVRREPKQQRRRDPERSTFSLETSQFSDDDLYKKLLATLRRRSRLTPRFASLLNLLLSADRKFVREELKSMLVKNKMAKDSGQAGRYLSNLSQFLTKKSNPHLRQIVLFEGGNRSGAIKDNYQIQTKYRDLVHRALKEA
jgi:hypothetical protein